MAFLNHVTIFLSLNCQIHAELPHRLYLIYNTYVWKHHEDTFKGYMRRLLLADVLK